MRKANKLWAPNRKSQRDFLLAQQWMRRTISLGFDTGTAVLESSWIRCGLITARSRKNVNLWHKVTRQTHTHAFPWYFFFHSFYFHILLSARRTHSVRLFSSYLIASRIRALEPSSNVAKRDVCFCLWRTQNILSTQLRKQHKRVDQNKLFAFFNSRAQASPLLPLRRQYNIWHCVLGWLVRFSYRLTSEHIIYNSILASHTSQVLPTRCWTLNVRLCQKLTQKIKKNLARFWSLLTLTLRSTRGDQRQHWTLNNGYNRVRILANSAATTWCM